mmetsp:Transcript_22367/g.68110  ORF Transcript_22367/g.68110 Transcript_22367/m.68110 type:complete len:239 (+) Transcript_22367:1138-1854(+)
MSGRPCESRTTRSSSSRYETRTDRLYCTGRWNGSFSDMYSDSAASYVSTRRTADSASRRDDNLTVFSKESRRVRSEPSARGCSSRMVRYASCTSASSAPDGDLGASLDPFSSSMSVLRLGVAPDAYSTFHFPLSSGEVAGERVGLADSSASRISPRTALSGAAAVKPSATSALSASFAMLPSSTSSSSARSGKAGSGASGSSAAESDGASSTCINGAARSASGEAMGRTASRPPGDSE